MEEFLATVADEYGWLGGTDDAGRLRCILPYTIVRKAGVKMVRFRVETIPCGAPLGLLEEKTFLNSVVLYFRKTRADVIIPASNNTLFRTYPDAAEVAPYGSYVIDLQQPEQVLWGNIGHETRRNIHTAERDGVVVREGAEFAPPAYDLIRETFGRSRLHFMSRSEFSRLVTGLGAHGKLLVADYKGVGQSYCFIAFSTAGAYGMYAGNLLHQHQGSMKLIQWESMRLFRELGVRKFDFYGARIAPEKGSKQEALNQMKKRLGAKLAQGYMWKCPLRPWRALAYSVGVRLLRRGDIVDQEAHKFAPPAPVGLGEP
jgi:hypothetical protein